MRKKSRDTVCRNCGHPIPILSALQRKNALRSEQVGATPLLLACPSCGHVYEYALPLNEVAALRRGGGPKGLVLRSIACECGDSNCKFPVSVHVALSAEIDAGAELAKRRARWVFHGLTCPFGHPLRSPQ
jgi:hypothetical protein